MSSLKKLALGFDRLFEIFALTALSSLVIIVTIQVFTRTFGNFVYYWSEEITLLLLIWTAFLGIAIGFREKLHLSMDSIARRLPPPIRKYLSQVIIVTVFIFGLYLLVYGWQYADLMHSNTLSATGWPRSVQYLIVPISGAMICVYSTLQFFGIDTRRHIGLDDDEEVD
ncbi:TRAP transporter small permease [Evansella sp. AB-P1]|uniref:TRAP transporter small permease n=1 Tax=Evansella sp. AB-P1 TaxID=3037653 RepID=UPI00241F2E91|nr:TRAP transporter small permease [Evansella sp. AB-P1]MDG5785983.1 TRAP transporter small permease [Evansella sp. AB-P1]